MRRSIDIKLLTKENHEEKGPSIVVRNPSIGVRDQSAAGPSGLFSLLSSYVSFPWPTVSSVSPRVSLDLDGLGDTDISVKSRTFGPTGEPTKYRFDDCDNTLDSTHAIHSARPQTGLAGVGDGVCPRMPHLSGTNVLPGYLIHNLHSRSQSVVRHDIGKPDSDAIRRATWNGKGRTLYRRKIVHQNRSFYVRKVVEFRTGPLLPPLRQKFLVSNPKGSHTGVAQQLADNIKMVSPEDSPGDDLADHAGQRTEHFFSRGEEEGKPRDALPASSSMVNMGHQSSQVVSAAFSAEGLSTAVATTQGSGEDKANPSKTIPPVESASPKGTEEDNETINVTAPAPFQPTLIGTSTPKSRGEDTTFQVGFPSSTSIGASTTESCGEDTTSHSPPLVFPSSSSPGKIGVDKYNKTLQCISSGSSQHKSSIGGAPGGRDIRVPPKTEPSPSVPTAERSLEDESHQHPSSSSPGLAATIEVDASDGPENNEGSQDPSPRTPTTEPSAGMNTIGQSEVPDPRPVLEILQQDYPSVRGLEYLEDVDEETVREHQRRIEEHIVMDKSHDFIKALPIYRNVKYLDVAQMAVSWMVKHDFPKDYKTWDNRTRKQIEERAKARDRS